jgi:hypothetical protein
MDSFGWDRTKEPLYAVHFIGYVMDACGGGDMFMSALGRPSDANALSLSIKGASVSGATGPILEVLTLRIPVSAIQTWWATGFEVDKNKRFGGGGISIGFSM